MNSSKHFGLNCSKARYAKRIGNADLYADARASSIQAIWCYQHRESNDFATDTVAILTKRNVEK